MFISLLCYSNGSNKIHILVTNHYYIDSNISICQIYFFHFGSPVPNGRMEMKTDSELLPKWTFNLKIKGHYIPLWKKKQYCQEPGLNAFRQHQLISSHRVCHTIPILDGAGLEMQCLIPGDQRPQNLAKSGQVPARSLFSKANLNCLAISLSQCPIWTPKEWFLIFFVWKGDPWFFWVGHGLAFTNHDTLSSDPLLWCFSVLLVRKFNVCSWGGVEGISIRCGPSDPRNRFLNKKTLLNTRMILAVTSYTTTIQLQLH